MPWFTKKFRLREPDDIAEHVQRRHALKRRLEQTIQDIALCLIARHHLSEGEIKEIEDNIGQIMPGIDFILARNLDAHDAAIPEERRGGAIIAQSADAFSHAATARGNAELERVVGSTSDQQTVGHICFQLDFERDGGLRQSATATAA